MPGKVNPVIPEVVLQVAAQVIGNDAAITVAGSQGQFELNVRVPLIARNLLDSIKLLASASRLLDEKCVAGVEANEEMKTVNSLLRGTIDSTPIGILVIDERNRVQMANRPLMDMLRATDMAIEGLDGMENLALLVGSAADDGWRVLVDAHLRGDEGTVNVTLSTTDGRIFDTTRSPYTVEGRPAGSIFTVKDVTEVRRMEGVLKESEARLRAIFTAAPVGICVVKDRRFVNVDLDNFDEVMEGMAPRAAYRAPNTLSGDGSEIVPVGTEQDRAEALAKAVRG